MRDQIRHNPDRILELRAQIGELLRTIRQLQRFGLDDAAPRLPLPGSEGPD